MDIFRNIFDHWRNSPWNRALSLGWVEEEVIRRTEAGDTLLVMTIRIPEWRLLEPSFSPERVNSILALATQGFRSWLNRGRKSNLGPISFRLSPTCLGAVVESDLDPLDQRIEEELLSRLAGGGIQKDQLEIGWSPVQWNDTPAPAGPSLSKNAVRSSFRDAVRLALHMGQDPHGWQRAYLRQRLLSIIKLNQVSTLFQPIIDLANGKTFGVEALSRGPAGSPFENPATLFPAAEQSGCLFQFENLCRQKAITGASAGNLKGKLFLNINPQVINDPSFEPGITMRSLKRFGFNPNNVVFEITERQAITDYASFCRAIEHYRRQGFLVAVDDAGAGYSSLQAISELRPDFVKLDMSLVRDLNSNPVRLAICEALIGLAERIHAKVIAEGIESGEELRTVASLGARYGQGYFLGRPMRTIPKHPSEPRWFGLQLDLEALNEAAAAREY